MKSDKMLVIKEAVFNLPDDFNGTVTDALELFLEYRKQKEKEIKINTMNQLEMPQTLDSKIDFLWESDDTKCLISSGIVSDLYFYQNNKSND